MANHRIKATLLCSSTAVATLIVADLVATMVGGDRNTSLVENGQAFVQVEAIRRSAGEVQTIKTAVITAAQAQVGVRGSVTVHECPHAEGEPQATWVNCTNVVLYERVDL